MSVRIGNPWFATLDDAEKVTGEHNHLDGLCCVDCNIPMAVGILVTSERPRH